MPRFSVLLSSLVLALPVQAVEIAGRVHDGGRGVGGVLVSNGETLVRTDADGRYRIDVEDGQTVFVIKPPQCALPTGEDGLPVFWRHYLPEGTPTLRYGGIAPTPADASWDFALDCSVPAAAPPFDVLVFGDTQVTRSEDVGYYREDIVAPILSGRSPGREARFGVTLGDVVNDRLSLYPELNAVTAQLGIPWLHAAGNHDMDFDAAHDTASLTNFRRTYGPDTLAYEEGPVSLLVLDDVIYRPGERPAYVGGLREDQFAFLEAYLGQLPRERLVVLAMHIPLFTPAGKRETFRAADRERLYRLLEPFPNVLVLSAHTHVQQHYFHGAEDGWRGASPLHEYNVGAVCGGFWGGAKDARGVPDAVMADGTPNGHALMRVEADGGYSLRYVPAKGDPEAGLRLYGPRVLRRGAYPGVPVYANVFMGIDGDRVEMRIGDGDWTPMTRVDEPDPHVVRINLADDAAGSLRGFDRVPQAVPSTHLWRAMLPTDLASGVHVVEVRAFDRWRGELRAQTRYRLDDAEP
ncbi:calcineurin-like phosphoesterase C-terminal domain-containing protein [Coralloluteibacterium thermophilus]|uniref:Calcineurin-like phosphoesterase C-terminal domain-containing protein n=1 Tax=Coralloluteibacterium thermophilum TaxID=2707049 RepID=A0ABV9NKM0_9GAMM